MLERRTLFDAAEGQQTFEPLSWDPTFAEASRSRGVRTDKVLILDGNHRSALAATRSLGRRGVHVIAGDETDLMLAGTSKYCRETLVYPSPYRYPEEFIQALERACRRRDIGILLPMTDVSMTSVLRQREAFRDVSVPFASFEQYELLTNKWELLQLAARLGIRIPKTFYLLEGENLESISPRINFPVVVKPFRSRIWSRGRWIPATVQYADSLGELKRVVSQNEYFRMHRFLVQEYIAGSSHGIFALYDRSKPAVFFAHRRLREKPPTGGVSVLSESVPLNPEMWSAAHKILAHVGWHGVAMVEFKMTRGALAYLMEVNARFWGSLQLAIDAGVDFPWLLYQLATGVQPDLPKGYRIGLRNRWLLGDFAHVWRLFSRGGRRPNVSLPGKWRALASFLNFFDPNTNYDAMRWNDPRPFFFELQNSWRSLLHPKRSGQPGARPPAFRLMAV